MAIMERLVRTSRLWRSISSHKTLTPSACLRYITRPFSHKSALPSEVFRSRGLSDAAGPYLFPVVLAGIFGAGVLEMAYAEANEIDGFEKDRKVIVIGATNRKQDLDPALISYAKHLTKPELDELARVTEGMSGRDIKDVCLQAERSWASKIIRGKVSKDGDEACLPRLQEYMDSSSNRRKALLGAAATQKFRSSSPTGKASQIDLI